MGTNASGLFCRIDLTPTEGSHFTVCALSDEPNILATGEANGTVRLWNMSNASSPTRLDTQISSPIIFLSFFGKHNDRLAVVNETGEVLEFELWQNTFQLSGRRSWIQTRLQRKWSVDSHVSLPSGMFHPLALRQQEAGEIGCLLKTQAQRLKSLEAAMISGNSRLIKECLESANSYASTFTKAASLVRKNFTHLVENTKTLENILDGNVLVAKVCRMQFPQNTYRHQLERAEALHLETADTLHDITHAGIFKPLVQDTTTHSIPTTMQATADASQLNLDACLLCVSVEDACKTGTDGVLRKLMLVGVPSSFFLFNIIRWIVKYKWHNIYQLKCLRELVAHISFFLFLTMYFSLLRLDWPLLSSFEGIVAAVLWVLLSLFTVREWRREIWRIKCYLRDSSGQSINTWTRLYRSLTIGSTATDLFSVLLLTIVIILHFFSFFCFTAENWFRCIAPIAYIAAYLKGIHLLLPFRYTSQFARMKIDTLSILTRHIPWVIMELAVTGFTVWASLSSKTTEGSECIEVANALGNQSTNTTLFLSVFLGGLDVEDFYCDKYNAWFFVAFLVAIASIVVCAAHILASDIGRRFNELQDEKEQQLTMSRAEAIDACESKLSDTERQEIDEGIAKYLFVLVSTEESLSTSAHSPRP